VRQSDRLAEAKEEGRLEIPLMPGVKSPVISALPRQDLTPAK
jgi:hypothetical protein